MNEIIGRVAATEKFPATMDKFYFWTNADFRLNAFDVVKVEHLDGSYSFGTVENIYHITDAKSFLTSYISNDFGDTSIDAPTLRIGMNYVEVAVSYNTKNIYTPVRNDASVSLASTEEIEQALGLNKITNPLPCGFLKMYADTKNEIFLPVKLNSQFILGPEGAHLNISGISGLAAKTSYAMFLIKSILDSYSQSSSEDNIAFIIFNVKGKDLMAIHKPNDDEGHEKIVKDYDKLGLDGRPFENVRYYAPFNDTNDATTYLSNDMLKDYLDSGLLKKFKYIYEYDYESLEMLFADVDDTTQTMDSIISKVIDPADRDFSGIKNWNDFLNKVNDLSKKGSGNGNSNEISVLSWRKFKRVVNKAIGRDKMFAPRYVPRNHECRLEEELKNISAGSISVIDIAKLSTDKQAFVFGDVLKTIYKLKLGEYDNDGINPPSRIVIFVDELNKYASKDTSKNSPILRQILDVSERGRSLGIVLFGAEQFRSNIHPRVTGNCSTFAFGRTNVLETTTKDYSALPTTYKNILTRLEQGEYVIQNPIFRSLLKIQFPKPIYKQFKD